MSSTSVTLDPAAAWLIDRLAATTSPWIVLDGGPAPAGSLHLTVTPAGPARDRPLVVRGDTTAGVPTLRVCAPDLVPAVAAVLLTIRDRTSTVPRLSCAWPERRRLNEVIALVDPGVFSIPRLRTLLRRAEPVVIRRPIVCASLA
ncbi:hypothetical protein [Dactylosporangium sp. CS-033363]|uniref:hypothetical protein n=1 Tax=Dactylosporangium sp. CS-033363 TaxID=3239935 RepID=UPI003D90277A